MLTTGFAPSRRANLSSGAICGWKAMSAMREWHDPQAERHDKTRKGSRSMRAQEYQFV
ncbi:hypothetical protein ACLI1C_10625 [Devosia sp. XGJD_8]|uniref:hypothetical protein n=1 Tax=Devosia sp. XGJD_8 TaxID=3391187 RepID=UPI0039856515